MLSAPPKQSGRRLGRYVIYEAIAAGGMATVHFGRSVGIAGFTRLVAIKHLHPHLALDEGFTEMFLDEARLAARVQHPNVVSTLDVLSHGADMFIVMDFVRGASLAQLMLAARERKRFIPNAVISSVVCDALRGLHEAHEARDERGVSLQMVHRDISPQNVIVGVDGVTRVADFGVAKAVNRLHSTANDEVKGKLGYMSPEQLERHQVDRRADLFAMGVVLWELLTLRRLFVADDKLGVVAMILKGDAPSAAVINGEAAAFSAILSRALASDRAARFDDALQMIQAIEAVTPRASPREVGAWVTELCGDVIEARAARIAEIESSGVDGLPAFGQATHEGPALANPFTLAEAPTAITGSRLTDQATPSTAALGEPPTHTATKPTGGGLFRGRRRLWWAATAGVFIAVFALAFVEGRLSQRVQTPSHPAEAPSSDIVAKPSASGMSPAPVAPTNTPLPAPSVEAGHADGPALSSATAPATRQAAPNRAKPKPASAGCLPPYTTDADGVRRYKPECI